MDSDKTPVSGGNGDGGRLRPQARACQKPEISPAATRRRSAPTEQKGWDDGIGVEESDTDENAEIVGGTWQRIREGGGEGVLPGRSRPGMAEKRLQGGTCAGPGSTPSPPPWH